MNIIDGVVIVPVSVLIIIVVPLVLGALAIGFKLGRRSEQNSSRQLVEKLLAFWEQRQYIDDETKKRKRFDLFLQKKWPRPTVDIISSNT